MTEKYLIMEILNNAYLYVHTIKTFDNKLTKNILYYCLVGNEII